MSARDGSKEMLDSVAENGHTFDACKKILREREYHISLLPRTTFGRINRKEIKLDSGFREFYAWCKAKDIPVILVSRFASMFTATAYA